MKRLKRALIAAVAGVTLLAAAPPVRAELNVVVTIKPIHSLVAQLMDGIGTPTLLVEGSASPHTFSLKPSNVRAINASDVFIRVSESIEPFTGKIIKTLPDDVQVITLDEAPGLKLLDVRTSGTFEAHADGDEDGQEHEAEDHHGAKDGHIWLDPDNAKAIVDYVAKALAERSPADASKLQANAAQLNGRIDALAAEIEDQTKTIKDKPFIAFHDAYHYFEDRFGLNAVGSITASPVVRPSAKRLTQLRNKIRSLDAVCVFAEPVFQPNLIAAVTEDTKARSGTLDPVGIVLTPGADLYFVLMRNLTANLKACLDPTA